MRISVIKDEIRLPHSQPVSRGGGYRALPYGVGCMPNVQSINTSFTLKRVKHSLNVPI